MKKTKINFKLLDKVYSDVINSKYGVLDMTNEQERHLDEIKIKFFRLVDTKYRKGQLEHGGNLFDMNVITLIDNAMDECIDQFTYLHTLRENYLKERSSCVNE